MDELIDLIVSDGSSSQISDNIKDILFKKSAENIETIRPQVATSLFDDSINLDTETSTEVEFDSNVELGSEEE